MPESPTFGNYARSQEESLFPERWENLVAAFASFLGHSANLPDHSGKANHGTFVNMDVTDWQGDALNFPGTDEYVDVGNAEEYNFANADPFTIILRVKPTTAAASDVIMARRDGGNGDGWEIVRPVGDNTKIQINLVGGGTSDWILVRSTKNVNGGVFYSLAFTYDGSVSASGCLVYIDGVECSSIISDTLTLEMSGTRDLFIGRRPAATPSVFTGDIESVLVYNRRLTGNEVATQSANPKGLFIRKPPITHFVAAAPVGVMAAYYYRTLLQGDRL